MKKIWKITGVVLCLVLLACGCTPKSEQAPPKEDGEDADIEKQSEEKEYQKNLDLIQPQAYSNVYGLDLESGSYLSIIGKSDGGQYWDAVKRGVAQAASDINEKLGYEGSDKVKVTYSGPATPDDVDEQVNILDEELSRYPVALGIAIVDMNACEVQFDLAAESDIPVIAFDSGSDYQGLLATVETDNDSSARAAADKLAEAMGDTGEVIALVHDAKSKTGKERESSFADQITTQHPGMKIVTTYHMDQLTELQKQIADEINAGLYQIDGMDGEVEPESITEEDVADYIFAKNPGATGCYATNEDAAVLALGGMDRANKDTMKVVAYDAAKKEVEALAEGKITGLVVQNPFGIGYAAVVAAARAALDMGNEAVVNTGYTWVTQDNLEEEAIQEVQY